MARSAVITIIATIVCVTMMFTLSSAANYNMIAEAVNSATSFPVQNYAEFEFSYATTDADGVGDRNVWIAFDLQDTKLVGNTCYIGNGRVDAAQYIANFLGYTFVMAPVKADDFFQVVCSFKTPAAEQNKAATFAYIGEFPAGSTLGGAVTFQSLLQDRIDAAKLIAGNENKTDAELIVAMSDADADVIVPDIFTESNVFTFHYEFEPEGRKLLNSTEIEFIRKTHFAEINPQTQITNWEDVLVADHYAELDFTGGKTTVSKIHLILYTKGTTSQFDFRLGLQRRVQPVLDAYSNPLKLTDLTYSVSWVYRSNCYNDKQDFGETGLNCGNPLIVSCGHCFEAQSTCTDPTECSSNVCTEGICQVEYGTFIERANAMVASLAMVAAVVLLALVF